MSNDTEKIMRKHNVYLTPHLSVLIREYALKNGIPFARVISRMVDNAFTSSGNPFHYDIELPESGEYEEYAFVDEAGKIISFLKKIREGMSLDILVLNRFEMDITDKKIFLAAFKEALDKGYIVEYVKVRRTDGRPETVYRAKDYKP